MSTNKTECELKIELLFATLYKIAPALTMKILDAVKDYCLGCAWPECISYECPIYELRKTLCECCGVEFDPDEAEYGGKDKEERAKEMEAKE